MASVTASYGNNIIRISFDGSSVTDNVQERRKKSSKKRREEDTHEIRMRSSTLLSNISKRVKHVIEVG